MMEAEEIPFPPKPPKDRIITESGPTWPWIIIFAISILVVVFGFVYETLK